MKELFVAQEHPFRARWGHLFGSFILSHNYNSLHRFTNHGIAEYSAIGLIWCDENDFNKLDFDENNLLFLSDLYELNDKNIFFYKKINNNYEKISNNTKNIKS